MVGETLEILDGGSKQRRVPLVGTLNIGKNPESDLVLTDPGVSWNHARIMQRRRGLWIADLSSTNGTYLNGVRLSTAWKRIKVGAEIVFGKVRSRVLPAEMSPDPKAKNAPVKPPKPVELKDEGTHGTVPFFRLLDQLVIEPGSDVLTPQPANKRPKKQQGSSRHEALQAQRLPHAAPPEARMHDTGKYAPPAGVFEESFEDLDVDKISERLRAERAEDTEDKVGSVLIIDDDAFFCTWASTVLNLEGYEAVTAKDGVEGLVELSQRRFSVILCDVCMPHLDGMEFLRISREKELAAPVIFTSAKKHEDEAMRNGGVAFLRKPVSQIDLLNCVRDVLTEYTGKPTRSAEMRAIMELMPGEQVGDFQVEKCIGTGKLGRVYLARQISLDRKVALKVFDPSRFANRNHGARLLSEAQAAARLVHPNVVQVYTVGLHEQTAQPFIAMEYVKGRSLAEIIARGRPLSFGKILHVAESVASALERASEKGIVHRGICPSNIVVAENWEIKVLDFGLARPALTSATGDTGRGVAAASSAYTSPEQSLSKELDTRSDLYALGIILYELLAGKPPFGASEATDLIWLHAFSAARGLREFRPNIPADFEFILERLLAKNRAHRYAEVAHLLDDLRRCRVMMHRERRLEARPEGPPLPPLSLTEAQAGEVGQKPLQLLQPRQALPQATSSRARLWWSLAAMGVLLVAGGLAWMLGVF